MADLKKNEIARRRQAWKDVAFDILQNCGQMDKGALLNAVAKKLNLTRQTGEYYDVPKVKKLFDIYSSYFLIEGSMVDVRREGVERATAGPSQTPKTPNLPKQPSKKEKLKNLEEEVIRIINDNGGEVLSSNLWQLYSKYYKKSPRTRDFHVLNMSDVLQGMDRIIIFKKDKKEYLKVRGTPSRSSSISRDDVGGPWLKSKGTPSSSRSSSISRDEVSRPWGAGAIPKAQSDFLQIQRAEAEAYAASRKGLEHQKMKDAHLQRPSMTYSRASPGPSGEGLLLNPGVGLLGANPQFTNMERAGQSWFEQNAGSVGRKTLTFENKNNSAIQSAIGSSYGQLVNQAGNQGYQTCPIPQISPLMSLQTGFSPLAQLQATQTGLSPLTQLQAGLSPLAQLQAKQGPSHMLQGSISNRGDNKSVSSDPVVVSSDDSESSDDEEDVQIVSPPKVDKLERKEIHVGRINFQQGRLPGRPQIEEIAQDCIEVIADANEYVSIERIEKLLLQRLNLHNLNQLQLRKIDQIKCVYEHLRTVSRVNAYVSAFVKTHSIYSLHELYERLREFVPEKGDFEKLHLGPLQRLPIIYDMFKFPQDVLIPEITTIDILEYIRDFMTKNNKWTDRLEMDAVMTFIVQERQAASGYHLGIGIKSLPLAAQVLKKAQRDAANSKKSVYEHYKQNAEKEISEAFRKFRTVMLAPGKSGENEIRSHYLKMTPEDVLMEIFKKYNTLMSCENPTTRAEMRRQAKMKDGIKNFISLIKDDDLAKVLFHVAICASDSILMESAFEMMTSQAEDDQSKDTGETNKSHDTDNSVPDPVNRPSRSKVLEYLKDFLERCLQHGALTLANLCRIEEKMTSEMGASEFSDVGFGRFLSFITTDADAKNLLSECGGSILGSSNSGVDTAGGVFKPSHSDVLVFIRQCSNSGIQQAVDIENALCNQFNVRDVKQLGYGSTSTLISASSKSGRHRANDYMVIYEGSLTPASRSTSAGPKQMGCLGHQTKDTALLMLHNCPLLTDMIQWTHWSLVFEPELGPLKDFVQKYGGKHMIKLEGDSKIITTDIIALETKPGVLLKLSGQSTTEQFCKALERTDVIETSGHLVSLIVCNKGVENTPIALLANQMKTTLFKLHSQAPSPVQGGEKYHDPAVEFVLQCLSVLPKKILYATATQIFLEPLSSVVGSTKSKMLLLKACNNQLQETCLEEMGCLFGIGEWSQNLLHKATPRKCDIEIIGDEFAADLVDESEDEEPIEIESDSDLSFLSDDEGDKVITTTPAVVVPPVVETIELSEDDKPIILSDEPDSTVEEVETKEKEKTSDANGKREDEEKEKVEDVEIKDGGNSDIEDAEIKDEAEEKEEVIFVEPHQAFIELIRKDDFGVGIELNADGERLIKIHQERQGRSLDRLSKDLYSKDTHFVLELIQNADDNSYSDEVVNSMQGPSVKFVVDESCITLLNNEVGFKEKEIKALCDVGCSTKGKHKYGYIGQKGIGFKSVFRITDKPEIHSNGYHFCFDVKSGPMGYIMPHWLEIEDEKPQDWMTKIALPFKPEMVSQSRSLAAKFNDIHPSLLLFLHRLKEISIDNQLEDSVLKMKRTDYDNIVEIKHGDTTDRWLVVKKMLDCTNLSIQAKSGVEVESTEIALAFPLKPNNYKKHLQVLPDKQLVFAFLPLRNYGFRFIVQGDFDVPSSRECVDRDSAWNQWIRNEIHNLFIESLEVFKAHKDFTEIEALLAFLQFVPMEDEILDFFKPVATQILAKLRAKECLPVVTGKDGNYQWKLPSQTVIVQDSLLREVISPDLLLKHLNLHYLCKDVAAMLTPSLAQNLGVEFIHTEHLLQIGRSLSQTFVSNQTEKSERVTIIAKWMACVYRSLDEFNTDEKIFNEIRCMKILPLSTGELTSLSDTTVFLTPVDRSTRSKRRNDPLSKIEQDLNTVDSGLIATEDNEINSQVHKLLQLVDVKQLSPDDLIHHHILPVLRSQDWKNKDRDVLVNYVMYIKDQYERQPSIVNLEELKSIVQIATNHGFKNPKKDSIHFTARYNNPIDLQRQLQGYDWVLVDAEYLTQGPVGLVAQQWRDFFTKLGVIDFLDVRTEDITIMPDNLDKTPWAGYSDMLPSSLNGYIISDFICDEFQALVTKNRNPETFNQQMKILFVKLDQEWDSIYSKFKTTSIRSADGQILRTVDSSFGLYLKSLKWVPAVDFNTDETDQGIRVNVKEVNMKASDLYVRDPRIEDILAHTVNYIQCNTLAASSFSKFLEIKKTLEVSMVKDLLVRWGKRSEEDKPVTFVGSLKQIQAIYFYLRDNLTSKDSQDLFIDNSVIFVPKDKQDPDPLKLVIGEMLKRDEVWWSDASSLFIYHHKLLIEYHSDLANKHIISSFYPTREFEEFFRTICRVQMNPNMSDYAELLVLLSTVHLPTYKSVFNNTLQIYSLIATSLTINDSDDFTSRTMKENERTKIVQRLSKQKIFCSKANVWVSLADKPMIADNLELEKKFAGEENVHFLKLTSDSKDKNTKFKRRDNAADPRVMMFIKMFPIPNLSDSVEITPQTKLLQPCPKVQLFMHHVIPLIQRFIYTHYYDDIYTEFKQSNMAEFLSSLQFFQADVLEVIYKLKHISGVILPHTENCVLNEGEFFVDKKFAENYAEINKEIAKFFCKGNNKLMKELRHFLMSVTPIISKRSEDSIDDVLNDEEVDDLPEDEMVWSIEAPIIIPPVVVPPPPVEQPASETQTESGSTEKTLRSWPPRAPDNPNAQQRSDSVTFKPLGAKLWPPPAPEGFVAKSRTDFLPSNIKVVAAETDEKTTDAADSSKNSENLRQPGDRMANEDGAARRPRSSEGRMNTDADGDEVVRRPSGTSRQSSTVSSTGGGGSRPVSREVDGRPTSQDLSKSDGSAGKRKIESSEAEDNNETKRHAPSSPEDNVDVTATMPEQAKNQTQPIKTSPSPESETNRQHRSPSRPLDPNHKRPFNFDAPKWQESSSVIPYEDLPLGDRPSLNIDVSDDPENERLVGRWGEQVVYDYLLQQKAANQNILDVNWVNEKRESGVPYDFIITYRSEKGEQLTLYSEVKSTLSDSKRMFEISMPEVKFAMDQSQNYEIYRLFNAGTSNNVRLVRISNIMDKDNIKLYMFI